MNLIDIPPNQDDDSNSSGLGRGRDLRKLLLQLGIALFVGVTITFSLAGSITLGTGEAFELGLRNYDVGTCAKDPVQVIPRTLITDTGTFLSQFTVSGLDPYTCDGRVIRILPFDDSNSPIPLIDTPDEGSSPDQAFVDIYVSSGEFLANRSESATVATVSTLIRTTGGTQLLRSSLSIDTATVVVYSGGQGRTLKSSEDVLAGLAISFQVRVFPAAQIPTPSGYGRTDFEIRMP